MKSLRKLFGKGSKKRSRRQNTATSSTSTSTDGLPRNDTFDSLNASTQSDDSGHSSSRNDICGENGACGQDLNSHRDHDNAGNAQRSASFDVVDNHSQNSNGQIRFRGSSAFVSASAPLLPDAQIRYDIAHLENLQNQWHAITREEGCNETFNDPTSDVDLEYAQNLQNEEEANLQAAGQPQESSDLPPEENIAEQVPIFSSIQQRQEDEMAEQAIRASLVPPSNDQSLQQEPENWWRLQAASTESRDCPDGPITTHHNSDWSRLLSVSEWQNAAYMTLMAFLLPIIGVGYLLYYLVKALEGIAKVGQSLQRYSSARRTGDTPDGRTTLQRSQGLSGFNANINNPLMLLILPIMLPIWLLQGISKAAQKTSAATASMRMPALRPTSTSFQFPRVHFRVRQPIPRMTHSFNRNRPCKCRCNECVVM